MKTSILMTGGKTNWGLGVGMLTCPT